MKKTSVKFRISVWITVLTAILSALLICFMVLISSTVVERTAKQQLWQTLKTNISYIDIVDGNIELADEFHFNQNGVSLLIYSNAKTLLAGQIPVSFIAEEDFESGEIKTVTSGDTEYLLLDIKLPLSWDECLWVRGLLEAPNNMAATQNLLQMAMVAMPVFILVAAIGGYLILDHGFKPLNGIISTASSINEAKDLSQRIPLPRSNDEFYRLTKTFNKLFARLERSFETEKQFTSDASHELRTPISVIKSACEYSRKYDDSLEECRESMEMIERQVDKMSRMVSQLLCMSRMDQGAETAQMEKLDLGRFVREFCDEQRYENVEFYIKEGITVQADQTLLGRLLQNLIENAYKYGKPQGKVWISVGRNDSKAFLAVRDDGIGIPTEHQQKIWQRFYQVDQSRSDAGGAGLGLSMVKRIAEMHGGYMTLESQPDEGSCFTLNLPATD